MNANVTGVFCPPPPPPVQAIKQWQAKVESVEPDVQRVMAEEREETALRKAEMEANKAHVGLGAGFRGQGLPANKPNAGSPVLSSCLLLSISSIKFHSRLQYV